MSEADHLHPVKSAAMQTDELQVTEARRFVKLAVVALIAAVRIMQIVIGRDGKTEQVLADAFDPAHEPALRAQHKARRPNRKAEEPVPDREYGQVLLDRRPFGWLVGIYLTRL